MNVTECYALTMPKQAKSRKRTPRVVRSISFLPEAMAHLVKRAKAESRSVNWLVNDLARQDASSTK